MSYNKGAEATGGLNRVFFCMLLCCNAYMYAAGELSDGSSMKETKYLCVHVLCKPMVEGTVMLLTICQLG